MFERKNVLLKHYTNGTCVHMFPVVGQPFATAQLYNSGCKPSECMSVCRLHGQPLRVPTAEYRGALALSPSRKYSRPTGSRSHATTEAPRSARVPPPMCTSLCPMGSRSRATTATSRAVRSSPLPHKGDLHSVGDLAVAGAPSRLYIQGARTHIH